MYTPARKLFCQSDRTRPASPALSVLSVSSCYIFELCTRTNIVEHSRTPPGQPLPRVPTSPAIPNPISQIRQPPGKGTQACATQNNRRPVLAGYGTLRHVYHVAYFLAEPFTFPNSPTHPLSDLIRPQNFIFFFYAAMQAPFSKGAGGQRPNSNTQLVPTNRL